MVELYSHQQKALDKLRPGSILVGGVGSGKSITSIAYFYDKICKGDFKNDVPPLKPRDLYIITTARKRDSLEWLEEVVKFGLYSDRNISRCRILVTIDSWNNIKKYVDVTNAFFIFDEQRVVGSGTWTKSFLKIAKSNLWILLSATPGDTWSDYIPVFVANGFYKNRSAFLRKHAVFDRFAKYPKISRYLDTDLLSYYRNRILVTMDFNRSTHRNLSYILVNHDEDLYNVAFKKRWNPYTNEPIPDAGQLCHILRRIVNSDEDRKNKVVELFSKHPRMIIFYNLNVELDQLRKIAYDLKNVSNFATAEWNGHKHEPIPTTEKWLYFVQYTAGAEGWNCVETDTIVFYSLNYSYKIMEQASGRIDRINTPFKELYYYRLISKASIDQSILRALKGKKNFNELSFVNSEVRT